ncbi:MAG: hypothetical protein U0326_43040 [Polyangiales bacterium]
MNRPLALLLSLVVGAVCACGDTPAAPRDASPDALVDRPGADASDVTDALVAPDVSDASDALDAPEVLRCELGLTFCGEACVNPRTDPAHCGRCDRACAAGEECLASACVARCQSTETRCDGRCVDLRTARGDCGACGRACAATEVCSEGECLPDCAASLTRCTRAASDGGVERYCADTRVERANCGACGTACASPAECMAGRCLAVCTATETRCGDTCHDLRSDAAHCGACDRACVGDERCLAGRCRVPCGPGYAECAETCVDLASDPANCGACGVRCRLPHVATARCGGARCAVGACETGFADCNGDPADGCEVDLNADASNCGACGRACRLAGAAATCDAGRCAVARCAPGRLDCDADPSNGCEVDGLSDDANCGGCSTAASPRPCRTGQVCASGACAAACGVGAVACSGDCVVTARDPRHCGACGCACALANVAIHACVSGACAVSACRAGFADCDGAAANGCEAAVSPTPRTAGACGRRCRYARTPPRPARPAVPHGGLRDRLRRLRRRPEQRLRGRHAHRRRELRRLQHCGGAEALRERDGLRRRRVRGGLRGGRRAATRGCAATQTDARHCGGCGRACRLAGVETAVCVSGVCAVSRCATGRGDCDGEASDGCEVDLMTSLDHCGACGRACRAANAAAACVAGACRVGACDAGFGDCDGDPANGCEVNLRVDPMHCGACSATGASRACPAGQVCSAGACAATCGTGTVACDGLCIDASADPANCGACRAACALANATASCVARTCRVLACRAGYADCDRNPANGCEVSIGGSDRANCGACGRVCALPNATGACAAGACVPGACAAGFGDCDGVASNGCETRLAVDGSHCGACGRRCAAGQVCAGSACVAACPTTATACAGSCRDTATDALACGACGMSCAGAPNAVARCLGGACGITCASGWGNCDGVASNGCERPLDTLTDCGACARPCALSNAVSACTPAGACALVACNAGFANCDGVASNGCEVNLDTDPARCGACAGRACATGQLCESGACVAACSMGRLRCGSGCVDGQRDARNCGSCGVVCVDRPNAQGRCEAGLCGLACAPGRLDCDEDPDDGCETDATTERDCGACGRSCAAGQRCIEGACRVPPGYRSVAPDGSAAFVDACAAPGAVRVTFAGGDAAEQRVELPFAFPFWGATRAAGSALSVSASGYVRVGADGVGATSGIIPSITAPDGVIAAHWGDLSTRDPQLCVAVVGAAPSRRLVIEWPDATYFDRAASPGLTFEAVLHETTGVIDLAYRTMNGARRLTTGVESPDGRAAVRPSIELHPTCRDTPGDNCLPAAGTVYRFVPGA